jgi:hypothetical protein
MLMPRPFKHELRLRAVHGKGSWCLFCFAVWLSSTRRTRSQLTRYSINAKAVTGLVSPRSISHTSRSNKSSLKGRDLGNGPGFDFETCRAHGLAIEPKVLISWSGIVLSLKLRPLINSVGTQWELTEHPVPASFMLMSFTCSWDCCCAVCQYCAAFVGLYFWLPYFYMITHILESFFFLNIQCKRCQIVTTGGWIAIYLLTLDVIFVYIYLSMLLEIRCNFLVWLVYWLQEVISISV